MQTEKSQPSGQWIMNLVSGIIRLPLVEISQSASETNVRFYFYLQPFSLKLEGVNNLWPLLAEVPQMQTVIRTACYQCPLKIVPQ